MSRLATAGLFALFLLLLPACQEKTGPDESEMRKLFAEARQLDHEGRYHEAMVRYETILARHPDWMSTRLNAAMAAYDSGQYANSAGHFEILHKYGANDWFVIRKLIQCYERLGNKDKVEDFRRKLAALRERKDGSTVLKSYQGFTRDYIPVGNMHLIGYEFFEPQQHGRLWFFKLEDLHRAPVSAFLVEASPFHSNAGRRLFYITESSRGWLKIWYVGEEGRDYDWARGRIQEILQGRHQPLVVKPLPPDLEPLAAPGGKEGDGPAVKKEEELKTPGGGGGE